MKLKHPRFAFWETIEKNKFIVLPTCHIAVAASGDTNRDQRL